MSNGKQADFTKVITPAAILSFPWVLHPQPAMKDDKGQATGKDMYSAALIFSEPVMQKYAQFGTTLDALRRAADIAAQEFFGDRLAALRRSPNFKTGFRTDGHEWGYPDPNVHINPRNERRPGLVYLWPDETGKPAYVPEDKIKEAFYAGAIVRASVRAFAFEKRGNRGVSFALNNIQLIDGTTPRLDGRAPAQDEFEADATARPASLADAGVEE